MVLNTKNSRIPLKAAVIGAGVMGNHHIRIYSQLPTVKLVGVVEPHKTHAEFISAQYQTPVFSSVDDMLDRVRPDLVSIAVPTGMHYDIATQLINSGIDVLLEKPVAATFEEGQKLVVLARQTRVILGVGHIERFNPGVIALKEQIDGKTLGKIYRICTRRKGLLPARLPDSGVTVDLATHDLDLMIWLLGVMPLSVSGQLLYKNHPHFEDQVLANLQFPEGVEATLEADWLSHHKVRELTVIGERGRFQLNFITQELTFYQPGVLAGERELPADGGKDAERPTSFTTEQSAIGLPEPLRLELETFVACCAARLPFQVSGEAGLKALYLAELLVKSGNSRQKLNVDLHF